MPRRIRQDKMMKTLFWTLGVLVVGLIVVLVLMLASGGQAAATEQMQEQIATGEFVAGLTVAGVDVSGMTFEEASANQQILTKAAAVVDGFSYGFTVDGKEFTFTADELGIGSDMETVLQQAILFGNVSVDGSNAGEQKQQAREEGVDFALGVYADYDTVLPKVKALKTQMDVLPQDAVLEIQDDVLGEDRFVYHDEVKGVDVDAAQLTQRICNRVNSGDFSVAEAPVIITNPSVDVAKLKANTKLIGTYTSVFDESPLNDAARVTNIKILADIVNGTEIQPGEIWSINEAAGPRNDDTAKTVGWAYAPGIASGRYEDQVGGGVCQVSSTVFNAAARAELTIVFRRTHSWPSSYIEKGMDATISTDGPDLKLSNPYNMPIYIAAIVDEEAFTLTVEVYGPPLTHGYTVNFVSTQIGTISAGESVYYFDSAFDPEGNPIAEGKTVKWISPRDGQKWRVYKQYLDANGNVVTSEVFSENTYKAFTGVYYVNGPDPYALPVATPTPEP